MILENGSLLPWLLSVCGGYLLGAVPFGLVLTRLAGYGDIRKIGSGNIGATNVLRTGNRPLALAVLVLDAGKGGIAAAGSMFLAASIIMLPIAITMLLINLAIGVITRSAPQLNLFSFGFPISMLAVFVVLYMSVGVISLALKDVVTSTMDNLQLVMGAVTYG